MAPEENPKPSKPTWARTLALVLLLLQGIEWFAISFLIVPSLTEPRQPTSTSIAFTALEKTNPMMETFLGLSRDFRDHGLLALLIFSALALLIPLGALDPVVKGVCLLLLTTIVLTVGFAIVALKPF